MVRETPSSEAAIEPDGTGATETTPASSPGQSASLIPSIFRLVAGRGLSILVALLAAPLLSRLYRPDDFGVLAVIVTIVATLGACTSGCYVMAMPLADSRSERRALLVLSSVIGLTMTGALTVVALLGADMAARAFNEPELAKYAIAVPVLFLASAALALFNMLLSCEKRFGLVAARNGLSTGGKSVFQVVAGVAGLAKSLAGLIVGAICGASLGALAFAIGAARPLMRDCERPFQITQVKEVAVRYRRFPLIQFWSQLLNALTVGLPVYVMGLLFSEGVVGLYFLAQRLVLTPTQLFAASGSQVFYIDASESITQGDSVAPATSELFRLLTVLTAFPLSAILVLGPLLFEIALGPPWREAGVYAQILVPWIMLIAVGSPLSSMLLVKNKLGENFFYNVVLFVVRLSALTTGGLLAGPRTALALFVAGSVLVWGHLVARTLGLAQVSRRWAGHVVAKSYGESLLLLAPAGGLYWILEMKAAALAAFLIACVAQIMMLYRRHPRIRAVLRSPLSGGQTRDY